MSCIIKLKKSEEKMERIQQQCLRHNMPKDAVIITRSEAIAHQVDVVKKWKPLSDVWPLIFGRGILIGTATISAIYINKRFRGRLKGMRNYGWLPTTMGITMGSAAGTAFFHTEYILNKLLLYEFSCPLCIEYRSILLQNFTGMLIPLILTPMANFSIAAGSGIYSVPHITDVTGIFRTILSAYRPLILNIATLFAFNTLVAGFITYSEVKSIIRMQDVQYLIEEERKENTH